MMADLARQGASSPDVHAICGQLARLCSPDPVCVVDMIYRWSLDNLQLGYSSLETLQPVDTTLEKGVGDLPDIVIVMASMLKCADVDPIRLRAVSVPPRQEPHHVYVQVLIGGMWVGLDLDPAAEGILGREPPIVLTEMFEPV